MAGYITPYEIKVALPDVLAKDELRYDLELRRVAIEASRAIERFTGRMFFSTQKTLIMEPTYEDDELWLPETLLEISAVQMSADYGESYETLATSDYLKYGSKNLYPDQTPYHMLKLSRLGNYSYWYTGERAIKLQCHAGYHDAYDDAWRLSSQSVQDNPLAASATTLTVTNADAEDVFTQPEHQVGQVLKIEDEQLEITAIDPINNTFKVIRAINGTTAASHAQSSAIYIYDVMDVLRRCVVIQSIRWFKRGQQSYTDVSANRDNVQNTYNRMLDMDVVALLLSGGLDRIDVT